MHDIYSRKQQAYSYAAIVRSYPTRRRNRAAVSNTLTPAAMITVRVSTLLTCTHHCVSVEYTLTSRAVSVYSLSTQQHVQLDHLRVSVTLTRAFGAHVSALLTRNDHAVGVGVTLTPAACNKTPFTHS